MNIARKLSEEALSTHTYTTTHSTPLSTKELLQQLQRAKQAIEGIGFPPVNGPMHVQESLLAVRESPVEQHKKRRHQSEAYHRRVQKKWTKRYGTKSAPAAYVIDNRVLGGSGRTVLAHPTIVARLKTLPMF